MRLHALVLMALWPLTGCLNPVIPHTYESPKDDSAVARLVDECNEKRRELGAAAGRANTWAVVVSMAAAVCAAATLVNNGLDWGDTPQARRRQKNLTTLFGGAGALFFGLGAALGTQSIAVEAQRQTVALDAAFGEAAATSLVDVLTAKQMLARACGGGFAMVRTYDKAALLLFKEKVSQRHPDMRGEVDGLKPTQTDLNAFEKKIIQRQHSEGVALPGDASYQSILDALKAFKNPEAADPNVVLRKIEAIE